MNLHDMYIIRRAGGDCLVHQRFGPLRRDSSLVTAFFRAVEGFSQEVLGSGGTLKRIDRGDVQFLFEGGEDVGDAQGLYLLGLLAAPSRFLRWQIAFPFSYCSAR